MLTSRRCKRLVTGRRTLIEFREMEIPALSVRRSARSRSETAAAVRCREAQENSVNFRAPASYVLVRLAVAVLWCELTREGQPASTQGIKNNGCIV
jgi:hypothetical protein